MEGYLGQPGRWKGAVGAVLVQGALLWVLVAGLAVSNSPALRDKIALFSIANDQPPPPPPLPPQPRKESAKEGAASPANIRSTATEVVAPKPVLPPPPQPIAAAPVANTGVQSTQGAAPVPGPGTGAGGVGNGFGSGGDGDGDGDGSDGGGTPPKRTGGRIKGSDLPEDLASLMQDGVDRVVGVNYAVEADGRVDDCRITRSSGIRELDIRTCELIEQKFRYRPALDEDRQPVKSYVVENQSWNFSVERERRR
ncbi:energy transducer TonB [Sphingomonas sp.]|jgi:protein TonB|uniref:energy transducer TonB n=1 Tax=Sphingomonas sp. TaxID=28214 RepID=UPI002E323D3B|nr:energy transducer TonB [Sphingomonas sp.]HEX4694866.1 energy transducer TonB [Sphingomonas sp.]